MFTTKIKEGTYKVLLRSKRLMHLLKGDEKETAIHLSGKGWCTFTANFIQTLLRFWLEIQQQNLFGLDPQHLQRPDQMMVSVKHV